MLDFLPAHVNGTISLLLYIINTIILCSLLLITACLKLVIPISKIKSLLNKIILYFATTWISINNLNNSIMHDIKIDVQGMDALKKDDWYLVVSNHQSWVDILILQKVFNHKIPFLKFFIKKELIWVPFLGLAWWALDFPFMQRYSNGFLKKHPELRGKDLETTKTACKKFKTDPTSVMNFSEGTRFSSAKHQHQQSPYSNLLLPRAGGIAFVLSAMNGSINKILDVTIAYPDGVENFWGFLCGRVKRIKINIQVIPVTDNLVGDYFNDHEFKTNFQQWLNSLWKKKDKLLEQMCRE